MSISDPLSIYLRGWFNENGTIPDNVDISLNGWFESSTVLEDYQEYDAMPNQFFQEEDTEYDVESNLFSLLATESINMHGVPMVYYITSFNTSYDKLLGEDNNRNITRNFDMMAVYELPNEEEIWNTWGIEGIDNFHIEISMRHFETASQYNPSGTRKVYQSYTPKEGDVLKAKYNDYFYEIVTVKKTKGQFLSRQHLWDIIVKPKRDEHMSVSATIPANDDIRQIEAIFDVFNVSATIENEKPGKLYDNSGNQQSDSLFGNW